jgi:hypothetical protein
MAFWDVSRLAVPGPAGAVPAVAFVVAVHGSHLEIQFVAQDPSSKLRPTT